MIESTRENFTIKEEQEGKNEIVKRPYLRLLIRSISFKRGCLTSRNRFIFPTLCLESSRVVRVHFHLGRGWYRRCRDREEQERFEFIDISVVVVSVTGKGVNSPSTNKRITKFCRNQKYKK